LPRRKGVADKQGMKPTLLILAAGMGSRFGGLKQIEPIGPSGEWILDFSVHDAVHNGFGKAVFVIREEMLEAFESVKRRYADHINLEFAFQRLQDLPVRAELAEGRSKPWGTGHAVYAARDSISEPFAVINADDFYGRAAFQSLGEFLLRPPSENEYALVGYNLKNTLSSHGSVSRGICHANEDGTLKTVEEHTNISRPADSGPVLGTNKAGDEVELPEDTRVSLNCWGFPAAFLSTLEGLLSDFLANYEAKQGGEFYLPFAVDALIQAGHAKARILDCSSRWLGVTHRDDLPSVKEQIQSLFDSGVYHSPLWK
jgi:UTP-glucose-1-phosphate uridylyltransferase